MKTLNEIRLLFLRSLKQVIRNGIWVAVGVATPLLYLALFTPLLQKLTGGPGFPTGNALDVFLPGILALLAFGNGMSAGYTTIFEIQGGTIERFRVTPISRLALLLGPLLSGIVWLFVFLTILVLVAVPFGFEIHILGLLVSFVLMALILTVMGVFSIAMALLTKDISSMAAVLNGLNLPILLLSGVLLPLTLAPQWMRILAHINPLYYVVEANRVLSQGNIANSTVGLAFTVIIPLTIVALIWATRVYRQAVS